MRTCNRARRARNYQRVSRIDDRGRTVPALSTRGIARVDDAQRRPAGLARDLVHSRVSLHC